MNTQHMRKFFRKGPIESIEVSKKIFALGFNLEIGGYDNDEVIIRLGLIFRNIRITPRIKIGYKQNTWNMGIIIETDHIKIGLMRWADYHNGHHTKYIRFGSIKEKIFGRPKHWTIENYQFTDKIILPKYPEYKELETIEYTVTHETAYRKNSILPAKSRTRTSIDIPQGITHPGKGTASYNQGDDATYGITTPKHLSRSEVKKLLAGDAYYYRSKYPL